MWINLFEEPQLASEAPRLAGRAYSKMPTKITTEFLDSLKTGEDVKEYLKGLACQQERYKIYRNFKYDVKMPLELLGVGRAAKSTSVFIDLRDSLDLVLTSLCGADPKKVRNIPRYDELSKILLDVSVRNVPQDLTLSSILEVEGVDEFFLESNNGEPVKFISSLAAQVQNITQYICAWYCSGVFAGTGTAVRSLRPAEAVLFSDEVFSEVEVVSRGETFRLTPRQYKPLSCLEEVGVWR